MNRLSDLQIKRSEVLVSSEPAPPPNKKRSYFLRGPVPLHWLTLAGALPGKTLHVGIVLWFLSGMEKTDTVALRSQWLRLFGFNRSTSYRALWELEKAGLVQVVRHRGRQPLVTIIRVSEPETISGVAGGVE